MSPARTLADLFDPEPVQWGLRGDPCLWRELREHFAGTPLPASGAALAACLRQAFRELTAHDLDEAEDFGLARLARGGMSSGMVHVAFWREQALPLLLQRLGRP